jgi:hypothetical protein
MQLEPGNCVFNTEVGPVEVAYLISDSGDVRHIAVVAELSLILGLAKRKYAGALKVELSMERLSNNEVADLYD